MNEVISTIKNRRSIRKFQEKQLSEMELDQIMEAAQYAPSGGNNQTCHFIVIQAKEVLYQLNQLVGQEFSKMEVYDGIYKSLRNSIIASKQGEYNFSYHAPTLVIAANKKGYTNAMADCACALENMMLAAVSLGIGSCWVNQLHWLTDNRRIKEFLTEYELREDEVICGSLILGYKQNNGPLKPLERSGNIITYIR